MKRKIALLITLSMSFLLTFPLFNTITAYAAEFPTAGFSQTSVSVSEGNAAVLTVSLSKAYDSPVSLDYSTSDYTAIAGSDYTAKNGTVTFTAGQTTAQIQISTLSDYYNQEDGETFTVTLSNPQNAVLDSDSSATVTISNIEKLPTCEFSQSSSSVSEGQTASISVTLSGPTDSSVWVDVRTADYTGTDAAISGTDYNPLSTRLTFAAGSTSASVSVSALSDNIDENDEYFKVQLIDSSGVTLGDHIHTVTINDVYTPPVLEFETGTAVVDETESVIYIPIKLSFAANTDVFFKYKTKDASTSFPATPGKDYIAESLGSGSLMAGYTDGVFAVNILDDSIYEYSEFFDVELFDVTNAGLGNNIKHVQITNNDPKREFSFGEATLSVLESTKVYTIPYTWTGGSALDANVELTLTQETATEGGTNDFVFGTIGLFKSPSDTSESGELTFRVNGDTLYEDDETFTITASAKYNCTVKNGSVQVTILDNDSPPQAGFSNSTYTVNENGGTAELTVRLIQASGKDAKVDYYCTSGTAADGSDFTAKSGTVTIPKNTLSKTITIDLKDDDLYEGNETFTVSLTNPSEAVLGVINQATVTIAENESKPVVSLESASLYMNEGGETTIKVQMDKPSTLEAAVSFTASDGTAAGGPGKDFQQEKYSLTIPAGQVSAECKIIASDNTLYEEDKYFTVEISAASSGIDIGLGNAQVTIRENDPKPVIGFIQTEITKSETGGADSVTLTVTQDKVSGADTTVGYSTSDGTAAAGADYAAKSGTLTIPAGSTSGTITFSLIDDAVYDNGDETFTVTLANPQHADLTGDRTATIIITDNESAPEAGFSAASAAVNEDGGALEIAVSMTDTVDEDVSIKYETLNGTAVGGQDFVFDIGTLTIPAGRTSGKVTVNILDDELYDNGDETFVLKLSEPAGASLASDSEAAVTIHDNEELPKIGFSQSAATVNENAGKAALTIKLTVKSDEQVGVHFATSNGTAAGGQDYTPKSGTLYINPGNDSATLQVSITDDSADENAETLYVTLSSPTKAALNTNTKAVITITDNDEAAKPSATKEKETDDNGSNNGGQASETASPTPAPTATPEPTNTGGGEDSEENGGTQKEDGEEGGEEQQSEDDGGNAQEDEATGLSAALTPETVEVNDADDTVTVSISRESLGVGAAAIRMPDGKVITLDDAEGGKIQIEINEGYLNDEGEIEIVVIDDADVPLGACNIELTDEISSLLGGKNTVPVWIWIIAAAVAAGLGAFIITRKKIKG